MHTGIGTGISLAGNVASVVNGRARPFENVLQFPRSQMTHAAMRSGLAYCYSGALQSRAVKRDFSPGGAEDCSYGWSAAEPVDDRVLI
jgi:hypothetical protein